MAAQKFVIALENLKLRAPAQPTVDIATLTPFEVELEPTARSGAENPAHVIQLPNGKKIKIIFAPGYFKGLVDLVGDADSFHIFDYWDSTTNKAISVIDPSPEKLGWEVGVNIGILSGKIKG